MKHMRGPALGPHAAEASHVVIDSRSIAISLRVCTLNLKGEVPIYGPMATAARTAPDKTLWWS